MGGLRLWTALAVIVFGMPAVAHAGTYDVRACGASSPQAFTLLNDSPQTIASGTECPQNREVARRLPAPAHGRAGPPTLKGDA